MIIAAFQLNRDNHTKGSSFGYERPLWPGGSRPHALYEPKLGCPIEIETRIDPHLVKIVEYYKHSGVVAEHLTWRFGNAIYPFRVRYIGNKVLNNREPLLFLPNVGRIHRALTGIDVNLSSPLRFFIDTVNFSYQLDHDTHSYLHGLQNHNTINNIIEQDPEVKTLKSVLMAFDNNYILGLENFISSSPCAVETFSRHFFDQYIQARSVCVHKLGNPFDTTPPEAIEIKHPEVTVYSPKQFHDVAKSCELLSRHYSDAKVRYILSPVEGVLSREVIYLVSRYGNHDSLEGNYYLYDVAASVAGIVSHKWGRDEPIVLTVELSYGDEALIEVYTLDCKSCIFAVHLDLAMISLCSSGVIAMST